MTNGHRTPYADDALDVMNGTEPHEIQSFVEQRAANPIEIKGVRVWNFNNHEVNREALAKRVNNLMYDEYVIPYQASGVWAYMAMLLPARLREAEILTYDQTKGQYNPYPNFFRHSENETNDDVRRRITERLREGPI